MQKLTHQIYAFDEFTLDVTRGCLLHHTEELKLRPKSFEVLKYLIENSGRLIGKDELIETVWQGIAVTDDSLVQCLKDIRHALNDKSQAFIKTVPRRGYIFEKEVSENGAAICTKETAGVHFIIKETEDERSEEFIAPRKPSKAASLFGREKEIVGIKNLLRRNDVQLATLTGAGGTGKTRLAQAVAGDCLPEFPDGVFFIELANISNAELVASTIANALGVKESGGKTLVENLINFLREKRLLLVLDNFEQIISAAPLLTELTDALPKLKILVTSRAALRLSDEYELIVPPLAVPPKDSSLKIDELENYSAVKLFIARVQTAKPNFIFNNETASVVAEICVRLDGLPLAIELAAARIKLLSLSAILGRLENSLKLLISRTPDLPARQQTMRGVVEWSYDLLEPDEKLLFNRLAVFAGGFTIEAAEVVGEEKKRRREEKEIVSDTQSIASSPHLPVSASVLDCIESLIDKNLLVPKEQTDGETRLRMLEVIREFALEKLETSGEAETLRRNHAEYFLALAEEADPHLQTAQAGEWLNRLEQEHDNLRAAIRWLFENDAEKAARLAAAILSFWNLHTHLTEGRRWLEAMLESGGSDALSSVRCKLLNGLGHFARHQGDYKTARKAYEEGLAVGKEVDDKRQIALSSRGLGVVSYRQGDFTAAREFIEEGLAISRELNDKSEIVHSLIYLGDLAWVEGETAAARPILKESIAICRQLGNKEVESMSLNILGAVAHSEGDYKSARSHFAEALATAQVLEDKIVIAFSLDGFAALTAKQGELERAIQLAGAAEHLRESINYEADPADRCIRDNYFAELKTKIDGADFALLYEQGCKLKLNEAVALAQSDKIDFAEKAGAQNSALTIYTDETAGVHLVIEETLESRRGDFLDAVKQNKRTAIFAAALLVVVVAVITAWRFYSNQPDKINAKKTPPMFVSLFQNVEMRNITRVGNIVNNAVSPDGRYAVYTTTDNGREGLWLRQIATDSTRQIIVPEDVRYFGVSFSRNGEYVFYLRAEKNNRNLGTLYRVPTLGGVPEKVLADLDWCPTFSPDGRRMAFVRSSETKNESAMMLADANGGNEQRLAVRPLNEAYDFPAWSPDGQTIAVSAGSGELGDSFRDVVTVNVADGTEKTLTTRKWYWINQVAWLADGSGLVMSANPEKSHIYNQLWLLSYPNGEVRQISNDSHNYNYVSLTADSRTLLAGHTELLTHLWIAPEGDAVRARRVSSGLGNFKEIRWTPDGKLAFTAFGNKNLEIYLREANGAEIKQLTVNAGTNWGNEVSSDNRYIVFGSDRTGDFHVWRMGIDGGNPVQLTNGSGEKFAEISPDGKWVVYTAFQDWTLWKVSIEGGEPVKIADTYARQSAISPNGKWIVYMASENNRHHVIPFAGGLPVKTFDLPPDAPQMQTVRWSPDSQSLQFIVKRSGVENIWQQPLDGGSPKQITNFTADRIFSYDWSDDGKMLAVIRGAWTADMILLSQKLTTH